MIDANYHTHTFRCKHASGDVDDYCQAAVDCGLTTLGFSDHAPLPNGRWPTVRMEMNELRGYTDAIDSARVRFPQLTLLKGLEAEYVPELTSFYQDVFLGEYDMEYLVGGAHWYPHNGAWLSPYGIKPMDAAMVRSYSNYLVDGMQSGLFAFIAHPDLFAHAYHVWDDTARSCSRDMLQAAADLKLPLEINGYGLRKPMIDTPTGRRPSYPWLPFWELAAECGTRVIINSDAHVPADVNSMMAEALEIARRFGLQVVETVPLCSRG